jgi:hypothetical protein
LKETLKCLGWLFEYHTPFSWWPRFPILPFWVRSEAVIVAIADVASGNFGCEVTDVIEKQIHIYVDERRLTREMESSCEMIDLKGKA